MHTSFFPVGVDQRSIRLAPTSIGAKQPWVGCYADQEKNCTVKIQKKKETNKQVVGNKNKPARPVENRPGNNSWVWDADQCFSLHQIL